MNSFLKEHRIVRVQSEPGFRVPSYFAKKSGPLTRLSLAANIDRTRLTMLLLKPFVAVAVLLAAVGVLRVVVAQQPNRGNPQDFFSKSFFAEYDALRDAHKLLEEVEHAIAASLANVEKNQLAIYQASFHWFYGRTLLQPQLWFNGGCKGKIERANAEIEKLLRERPSLIDQRGKLKQEVKSRKDTMLESYEFARQRVKHRNGMDRNGMFEKAIQQYCIYRSIAPPYRTSGSPWASGRR